MIEALQTLRLILIGAFGCVATIQFWLFWSRRNLLHARGGIATSLVAAFIAARYMKQGAVAHADIYFWVQAQYATAILVGVVFLRILAGSHKGPHTRWILGLMVYTISLAGLVFIPGFVLDPELIPTIAEFDGPTPQVTGVGWLLISPAIAGIVTSAFYMYRERDKSENETLFQILGPVGAVLGVVAINDMLRTAGVPTIALMDFGLGALGLVLSGFMGKILENVFITLEQDVESRTKDLEETTRGLRDLMNGLPDLVVLVRNGMAEPFSEEARATWGTDPVPLHELAATSLDGGELAELENLEVGDDATMRVRLDSERGTFPAEIMAVAVMLGGERAVVASARDLSEREEIERRLRLNDRLASVGTLAAGVAHEINNPLTYVAANISYVREWLDDVEVEDGEELRDALDDAAKGAARVAAIVRELRHFGRPEDAPSENASVEAVVEFAVRLVQPTLRNRCVLENEIDERLPTVKGDEGRITQVLVNLLTNAADAMPPSRSSDENKVTIRSVIEQDAVTIIVEDNGQGMSADQLEHVFDPFFTTKVQGAGMGLGLSICHKIATELGASMKISSEVDRGTRVALALPRQIAKPRHPSRETIVTPSLGFQPVDLLVVEDESAVLKVLEREIGTHCRVTAVSSATEAIEVIESGKFFDGVLCDLMMPGMNGREFFAWLSEHAPSLASRMTIVTAGAVGDENVRFLKESGVPTLDKPLTRPGIRKLLDSARASAASR